MIYLDTSVALAHLLAEDRHPPDGLWTEVLVSSRLIEYEVWTHLASADFLRAQRQTLEIASYDDRLSTAAGRMGFSISRYCSEV
jgi:hypothetical protein